MCEYFQRGRGWLSGLRVDIVALLTLIEIGRIAVSSNFENVRGAPYLPPYSLRNTLFISTYGQYCTIAHFTEEERCLDMNYKIKLTCGDLQEPCARNIPSILGPEIPWETVQRGLVQSHHSLKR